MGVIWPRKVTICAALCFLFVLILGSKVHANTEFKLLASDGAENFYFGSSVSISGDVALVGAYGENVSTGTAYIYRYNGSSWAQEDKLVASDGDLSDQFGISVSISGNVALVGACGDDDTSTAFGKYDSGSAYIFRYNGSNWVQEQKLVASDGTGSDYFGWSVAISGNVALVGAIYDDDHGLKSGSAYIFRYNGSSWAQEDKLLPPDSIEWQNFGNSVSISGDAALVGAHRDNDKGIESGSAYIYRYYGSNWVQEDKLVAADGDPMDRFGNSVSISGDVALVGASEDNSSANASGSAYIFRYNGSNWVQENKLVAYDGISSAHFGKSVSISSNVALVGAHYDDDNGPLSGSAYIFRYNGSGWVLGDKLVASNGSTYDYFGFSVSVNGDAAIVGANGDADNGNDSGSAYIFDLKQRAMPWIQLLLLGE